MPTAPYLIRDPVAPPVALVVESPHSGMTWPPDFTPIAGRDAILTTWDAYVDELWDEAPSVGATWLAASFPRAYIDVNRAEDDLDLGLLAAPWPSPLSPTSYSVRGMGLIRRLALPGVPMYEGPLALAEVRHRIDAYYRPYRAALGERLSGLRARFGIAWHLDCHSMKSRGNEMNVDAGEPRPDFVISDRYGRTADPAHTRWVADWFQGRNYAVQINEPYQGGDLVATFGSPPNGVHSIQIEINRRLYLDEATAARGPGFDGLKALCSDFLRDCAAHVTAIAEGRA